eukprot:277425-Pyramimonas_sp.AAC.1
MSVTDSSGSSRHDPAVDRSPCDFAAHVVLGGTMARCDYKYVCRVEYGAHSWFQKVADILPFGLDAARP